MKRNIFLVLLSPVVFGIGLLFLNSLAVSAQTSSGVQSCDNNINFYALRNDPVCGQFIRLESPGNTGDDCDQAGSEYCIKVGDGDTYPNGGSFLYPLATYVVVKAGNGFSTYLASDPSDSCYTTVWHSDSISISKYSEESKDISHIEFWFCENGDENKDPVLTLEFDCLDRITQERKWKASAEDSDDDFPISLGYSGISSDVTSIGKAEDGESMISFSTPLSEGNTISLHWLDGSNWVSGVTVESDDEYCITPCTYTTAVEGEWSTWEVDPDDDTQEFRTRVISTVDELDNSIVCESETETEYRDIEEEDTPDGEGDVLGESDEDTGEVLGTSTVVLAETGPSSNVLIYIVEAILLALTSLSFVFFRKEYLKK